MNTHSAWTEAGPAACDGDKDTVREGERVGGFPEDDEDTGADTEIEEDEEATEEGVIVREEDKLDDTDADNEGPVVWDG